MSGLTQNASELVQVVLQTEFWANILTKGLILVISDSDRCDEFRIFVR